MLSKVALGVGAALATAVAGGCMVGDEEVFSSTEELLRNNGFIPSGVPVLNRHGYSASGTTAGRIDLGNEFFQDLGTNGRRCVSCHLPTAGWTITPEQVQAIFERTDGGVIDDGFGLGAVFRTNDGASSPTADVSTLEARREAYGQLLEHGLVRVGMALPATAEFELVDADDPFGHASAADLSLFRRPLPTANLRFLSAVMWDGRETRTPDSIHFDLSQQASDATTGHAQGPALTDAQRQSIVAFEIALHTAQIVDHRASRLDGVDARGGLRALVAQPFYYGINDNFDDYTTPDPGDARFDPNVFDLYGAWGSLGNSGANRYRQAIARGEALFNTMPITLDDVPGLTAMVGPDFVGTCTTCHNTPNAGNHSVIAPLDIGVADPEHAAKSNLPIYTLRNKATGELVQTTDPGRAMITGKWADVGKFKGPVLRGLAARAPYFHNGIAKDLVEVVEFYDARFDIGMTAQQKSDLAAFLAAL